MSIDEWMLWDGVNAPLVNKEIAMSGKSQNSEVVQVTVVVPTREVVEAYNRFDTSMTEPCPACGEEWQVWRKPLELVHTPDCAYITWLEQDCPTPDGIIPA